MASNLYPLTYKPGIKRDGSTFQPDFCTDGQWVRFQRGNIRKIGGMKGATIANRANSIIDIQSISIIPISENNIKVYIAGTTVTGHAYIDTCTINSEFGIVSVLGLTGFGSVNTVWQYEYVVQGDTNIIVYLLSPSLLDINNSDACEIHFANVSVPRGVFGLAFSRLANGPSIVGISGLLFASNYLFVYGSYGAVQWSRPNNPLDFTNPTSRQISISNSKVIYAASIRGGLNSPAILFWTMTSVVRFINNPTTTTPPDTLAPQIDTISKTCSILSSRCVVEYNGRFFWPGTNKFYYYDGLVGKLKNNINLNYFFNNIDMTYRQNVFGVRNAHYDEIWWFYPEKLGTPGRLNVPRGQNTRAIVYNVEDDFWYDTAISRSCGIYSDYYGFMATCGRPLTSLQEPNQYFFRHEFETVTPFNVPIEERWVTTLGLPMHNPITSYFTTPTISWASFNAMKQLTGVNRWLYLITIEPDFTLMPTGDAADMTVTINTKQYAQDFPTSSPAYNVPFPLVQGQDSALAKIDTAWQGRYITLTFNTTANFEMGQIMLNLGIGDGQ